MTEDAKDLIRDIRDDITNAEKELYWARKDLLRLENILNG